MKQKGLAAGAIAAIVVVGIVVAAVAVYFLVIAPIIEQLGPKTGVEALPVYTGGTKADTVAGLASSSTLVSGVVGKGESVPTGVEYDVYTSTTGSVNDVMTFYKTEMDSAGWTKEYENTYSENYDTVFSYSLGLLYFEKGDRGAVVGAVSYTYEGESYLYFAREEGPKSAFVGWGYLPAAALGITTTSLSAGTVDAAYSATLAASGGTSPYTWSVESGSLPDGLSLSTGGVISGTPTTEGDSSFTVKVTDSDGTTDTQALSIHVAAAGAGEGIAGATSLSFKIDYTMTGVGSYTYWERARNIGTANMDLRVDITTDGTTVSWIYSGSQQEGWYGAAGYWMSFSSLGYDFSEYWSSTYADYTTYTGYLADWTSGEWEETVAGITYRLYDIQVNPTIPDSVFTAG